MERSRSRESFSSSRQNSNQVHAGYYPQHQQQQYQQAQLTPLQLQQQQQYYQQYYASYGYNYPPNAYPVPLQGQQQQYYNHNQQPYYPQLQQQQQPYYPQQPPVAQQPQYPIAPQSIAIPKALATIPPPSLRAPFAINGNPSPRSAAGSIRSVRSNGYQPPHSASLFSVSSNHPQLSYQQHPHIHAQPPPPRSHSVTSLSPLHAQHIITLSRGSADSSATSAQALPYQQPLPLQPLNTHSPASPVPSQRSYSEQPAYRAALQTPPPQSQRPQTVSSRQESAQHSNPAAVISAPPPTAPWLFQGPPPTISTTTPTTERRPHSIKISPTDESQSPSISPRSTSLSRPKRDQQTRPMALRRDLPAASTASSCSISSPTSDYSPPTPPPKSPRLLQQLQETPNNEAKRASAVSSIEPEVLISVYDYHQAIFPRDVPPAESTGDTAAEPRQFSVDDVQERQQQRQQERQQIPKRGLAATIPNDLFSRSPPVSPTSSSRGGGNVVTTPPAHNSSVPTSRPHTDGGSPSFVPSEGRNHYESWTTRQVAEWLKSLGAKQDTLDVVLAQDTTMSTLMCTSSDNLENVYLLKKLGPRLLVIDQLEKMKRGRRLSELMNGFRIDAESGGVVVRGGDVSAVPVYEDAPPAYTTRPRG
ncbi:UNVERIFIED_CONTAM: hypothetical protein HDU68_010605 [Siphonaria sp. JEL0065]|nr:hypothetical protein HDU68_010605 [Siphonaria sp. JEL0065]